ncbi:uncharacterized protein LOC124886514 [Capsicum annuum]|uniref:uncharacterized protein LOC124886514 n=1 Tax=Capsicum annuum TaxID=4072 RepID=UPI001FB176A0|nr:uncharacterized protein LOC124886514 [Capsicum annuum]
MQNQLAILFLRRLPLLLLICLFLGKTTMLIQLSCLSLHHFHKTVLVFMLNQLAILFLPRRPIPVLLLLLISLSCWKKKILIHLSCLSLYLFMKTFQTPLCLRSNKFRRTLQNPLCLCFQNFLKTYLLRRILQTVLLLRLHRQCSIGSQDSSVLGNPSHKRCLFQESGEEKFFKKIKVTKDSWITKPLTKSDVNGCSRLLLPRQEVKNYVLPFMDEEQQYTICNDSCGIDVTVFDVDTQTEHSLTFKKWNGNFYLIKAWTAEFVKRRNLEKDDVISIR